MKIIAALCLLFFSIQLPAQICNGSLGDAVVNVNFGNGPNPGNSLPASTTNYNFTSSSCPGDGSYTIVNSSSGCFGSTWQTILADHTPQDADGYMMLVNASFTPGDFYLDTVKNLCAGTQYEFGAWVMNVLLPSSCNGSGIKPQLTFKIETPAGVSLGTYNTGDIPSANGPTWTQYGFFFTTPPNNSTVVIRLTNNAPGGCGNDLALDDITFRPCGPTVTAGFANVSQQTLDLCIGYTASATLSATVSSGYTNPSYQWQLYDGTNWVDIPGATALTYVRSAIPGIGTYQYRLTVAEGTNIGISNCRVASNEATITVHDLPVGSATSNGPVCEGANVSLTATGGSSYVWTGPAGFTAANATPGFVASNTSAGQYTVVITDQFGCMDTKSTVLATFPKPVAIVSNNQNICTGDSVTLVAGGGNSYTWLPLPGLSNATINNPVAKPDSTITYVVTVTGNNNCTDTASVLIVVNTKPIINAGADKVIIKGQSVLLNGTVQDAGNISFSWSPAATLSNAAVLAPLAKPLATTDYILTAASAIGCGNAIDTATVTVYTDLYIPNAFSPNGIGANNTWHIDALLAYPNAVIAVYNRYGEKVFESSASNKDWNGKYKNMDQPTGAYPYIIDLRNKRPVIKGMVMIVR